MSVGNYGKLCELRHENVGRMILTWKQLGECGQVSKETRRQT